MVVWGEGSSTDGGRVVEGRERERIDGTKRVCLRLLLHIVFGDGGDRGKIHTHPHFP